MKYPESQGVGLETNYPLSLGGGGAEVNYPVSQG